MLRLLHVNVRLTEGGAARIALDLHERALGLGMESKLFYGYGKSAKASPVEKQIRGARCLGSRAQVVGNYATHKLLGMEFLHPARRVASELCRSIASADVVHLHVLHSYYLPLDWMAAALTRAKRVIWTCHDYWPITGRCAFLEECEGWRSGCGLCRGGRNYPPAWLDMSRYVFKRRRALIDALLPRMVLVAPTTFVAEKYRDAYPSGRVEVIHNGVDSWLENAAEEMQISSNCSAGPQIKLMVMANDLNDPTKVDRALIDEIMQRTDAEVHTIGRNSPFFGDMVVNHGEIGSRKRLVELLGTMDALLFTSRKDTFGLVMAEAIVCGVPVLALESDAADEVLGLVNQKSMGRGELFELLSDSKSAKRELTSRRMTVQKNRYAFSGARMFEQYHALYREGVGDHASNG